MSTLEIREIMERIPHRYPFLLVDRVLEIVPGRRIVAIKNVTINEPFFQGHFPGAPVMPGVLIIEALAQAGAVLLLSDIPNGTSKLVYFTGIDEARFRRPVVPGDQLRLTMEVLKLRARTCKMRGRGGGRRRARGRGRDHVGARGPVSGVSRARIDPRAVVHQGARLGADVVVGPFCVVGPEVDDRRPDDARSRTSSSTAASSWGPTTSIAPFASLGGPPQDLKYAGEPTQRRRSARGTGSAST